MSTRIPVRDDAGTTTAEYAVVTGAAVGFAALLFTFVTSGAGSNLISRTFNAVLGLLPF